MAKKALGQSDLQEMAKKALDNLNDGNAGAPGDLQEEAKKALDNMDHPKKAQSNGIEGGDIKDLAKIAMGKMTGVSSKFMPTLDEEDNSLETLTNKALNDMPTGS
jgi:hypothetical protein